MIFWRKAGFKKISSICFGYLDISRRARRTIAAISCYFFKIRGNCSWKCSKFWGLAVIAVTSALSCPVTNENLISWRQIFCEINTRNGGRVRRLSHSDIYTGCFRPWQRYVRATPRQHSAATWRIPSLFVHDRMSACTDRWPVRMSGYKKIL